MRDIVTKFRTKFTLLDIKLPTGLRRVRTEENIAAVSASVNNDHQLLIRRLSQQMSLCYSTTWKNFAEGFSCEAFQNTAGARIEATRPTQRTIFAGWALKLAKAPLFDQKIVCCDDFISGSMGT